MDSKFRVYLRKSDSSHPLGGTGDLSNTQYKILTKENIFENFLSVFGTSDNITIMADNVKPETVTMLKNKGLKTVITSLGAQKSFVNMVNLSLKEVTSDDDIIYFVEDDYLHMPEGEKYIREGLELGHYVSLYDSLDKYKDTDKGGYNPLIAKGGEVTKVIISETTHWKYTNATTLSFAVKAKTLKEDYGIFMGYSADNFPMVMDFLLFRHLITKTGRILLCPIPGRSAHVGLEMSPFVDWLSLIKENDGSI